MKHHIKHRHLGRNSVHRKALLMNLSKALIEHEQIKTTSPKAKELRGVVEQLITLGKDGSLSARKRAYAKLQNKFLVNKLFNEFKERYQNRNGGYTSIFKAGFRKGDCAEMSIIELVDRNEEAKGKADLERIQADSPEATN